MIGVTDWGLKQCKKIQEDYNDESWMGLKAHFEVPGNAKRISNLV